MYSSVGVTVNMMGQVGEVNQLDPVSKKSLPGKTRGKIKLYSSSMSRFQSRSFDKVYQGLDENDNYFFQLSRNVIAISCSLTMKTTSRKDSTTT